MALRRLSIASRSRRPSIDWTALKTRRQVWRRLRQESFLQAGNAPLDRGKIGRARQAGAHGCQRFLKRGEPVIEGCHVRFGDSEACKSRAQR